MRKVFSKRLRGSFTIEITYISIMIFVAIIMLFSYIYKEYASTNAAYIIHYNANTLLEKNNTFKNEFTLDKVMQRTGNMLSDVNILKNSGYSIKKDKQINASILEYGIDININEFKPIEFMRKCAVLEDMYERNKGKFSKKK